MCGCVRLGLPLFRKLGGYRRFGGREELLPDVLLFFQSFAYVVRLSVAAGRSALLSGQQTERCNMGILVCYEARCKLDGVTCFTDRVC